MRPGECLPDSELVKDFEETRTLETGVLHDVLASGDPRDRVLAIWALAMRSTSVIMMADQLRAEPDAGVRRALAVVLASNGELDLLVAISRHDPSVHVRASAVQMLVRFAIAGQVPWSLVEERLTDAAEVRASLMSQVQPTSPEFLTRAAIAGLRDAEDVVRREAFETCIRLSRAGAVSTSILRDALDEMNDGDCANALSTWFGIEEPHLIGTVLAASSRAVRERALRMRPRLVLSALAPLLGDDAALFAQLEFSLRLRFADGSTRLVLELGIQNPARLDILRELVRRLEPATSISAAELELLGRFLGACEAVPVYCDDGELAISSDDDEDGYLAHERERRLLVTTLRDAFARFS